MQSKKSCFNSAVFKKNLTRFAPVMGLYTLLLLLLILMAWSQSSAYDFRREVYFLQKADGILQVACIMNLAYAALVAQLLFGDLYSTRMCNAMHAMPLRRETWFVTNTLSGLVYSLIPSAIATVVLLPLLMQTIFIGAWKVAILFFLSANLFYICFFGIAVFSVMLVGSRLTMVAAYGLINFGALIAYWLVDTVYTPMLYGIVTPHMLAYRATPVYYASNSFIDVGDTSKYIDNFGRVIPGIQGTYTLTETCSSLWILGLVGIVFAVIALVLYRRRNLECAGDAVCSAKLVPVFQVLSALFVAVALLFFGYQFLSIQKGYLTFVFLFSGLLVGWFAGKMMVERSARVFQGKNWLGLGILAVVLAVSLGLTKMDVFRLEYRMPELSSIEKVSIGTNYTANAELTEPADLELVWKIHSMALSDRAEQYGTYVLENGEFVYYEDSQYRFLRGDDRKNAEQPEYRYAIRTRLIYTLKNGREVQRVYNVWADSPEGDSLKGIMTRWDVLNSEKIHWESKEPTLPYVLANFEGIYVSSEFGNKCPEELKNRAAAESLLQAIQADCADGNMAQDPRFHKGAFSAPARDMDEDYESDSIYLNLSGKDYGWSIDIFPECTHTIRWLQENGMLREDMTILPRTTYLRVY